MRYADEQLQDARKRSFLDALARTGVIGDACDAAGISRTTYRNWRKEDEEFAALLPDAFAEAADGIEREARRRAIDGVEEPLHGKDGFIWKRDPATGELILDDDFNPIPYTINKKSDRLLEILLKGNVKKYRDPDSALEVDMPGGDPSEGRRITVRFIRSDGEGGVHPEDRELLEADRAEQDD